MSTRTYARAVSSRPNLLRTPFRGVLQRCGDTCSPKATFHHRGGDGREPMESRLGHDFSRVAARSPTRSSGPPAMIRRQAAPDAGRPTGATLRFTGCSQQQRDAVLAGIPEARALAEAAADALEPMLLRSFVRNALSTSFGPVEAAQKQVIVTRLRAVAASLGNKRFRCQETCRDRRCAQGEVGRSLIIICPGFGQPGCEAPVALLHEAVHNAGAPSGDVDPGAGRVPPRNPQDNPYAYERFAQAIAQGEPRFELPPKRDVEIP